MLQVCINYIILHHVTSLHYIINSIIDMKEEYSICNNGLVFEFSLYQQWIMNPIRSNICVAIAATMYCVEEETKIKIYHTLSGCAVAMQQLDNL